MGSGTALGKAPNTVEDSVNAIRFYAQQKTLENSGEYLDVTTGKIIPF